MEKRAPKSISTKLRNVFILLVVFTAGIITTAAIISMLYRSKEMSMEIRDALMENYKKNTKIHVKSMAALINKYTDKIKGNVVPEEIKKEIFFIINNTKDESSNTYYFINGLDSVVVVNGNYPSLNGENLYNYKTASGVFLDRKLSEIAINGGGFYSYYWAKSPNLDSKKFLKLSYVQLLDNVPWYIGSGVYIADVDKFIKKQADNQFKTLRMLIFQFVLLSLLLIIIALFISFYFSRRIAKPIIDIADLAKNISEGDYNVKVTQKYNDELGIMADSFNTMAEKISNKVKKLTQKERYISLLFESVADGLIVTDTENKIVRVNSAATKMFEASKDELLTTNMSFLLPIKNTNAQEKSPIDEVLEGKYVANFNVTHKKADGSESHLAVAISPVKEDGLIKRIVYSIKDATEQYSLGKKIEKMNHLKKYFTPSIVEELMSESENVTMDYSRKKVTIFFSDLVGFSDLSDNLEAEELTAILGEYLTCMSNIVYKYSGTLDKFIGDAVMVFFGAPNSNGVKEDAINCVKMALEMQDELAKLNKKWKLEDPLSMRIGINTGFVTVGNFGSEMRLEYTIIGAPVNIASRLEQSCPTDSILISHDTAQYIQDLFNLKEGNAIHLKGFHHLVKTYEVLGVQN